MQGAVLEAADRSGARIYLNAEVISIGRAVSGEHDILISPQDTAVSREHARLILENGNWLVEDCSRNGTLVNGEAIKRTTEKLSAGDHIQIGKSFDYYFFDLSVTEDFNLPQHAPERKPAEPPPAVVQRNGASSGNAAAQVVSAPASSVSTVREVPPGQRGIWISPSAVIWRDGEILPVTLSRTEYRLLKYLASRPGDVCEYEAVMQAVWGDIRNKDSLHELIFRLRRKIERSPSTPRFIVIRSGIGIVFFPQGLQ
jgi:hypothetical protein